MTNTNAFYIDTYAAEFAFLADGCRATDAGIESTGGGLHAIGGNVAHDDNASPATRLLATNTPDGDLADTDTGYWLVGMYDDDDDTSDEALVYGEGDTLEAAYNSAVTALRALNS
jgi:hypothetical protein